MDLIIKDAKMPLSCASCFAYDSEVYAPISFPKCKITGEYIRWVFDPEKVGYLPAR